MKSKIVPFLAVIALVVFTLTSLPAYAGSFVNAEYVPPDLSRLTQEEQGFIRTAYHAKKGDLWVVLTNGLTVLVREMKDSNVASVRVQVNTGSIDEGANLTAGLSHYLEHVVSGGSTKTRTETEIQDIVKGLGGASNAFTTYDKTVYFIETTGDKAGTALDVLLDTVFGCIFDPKEVAREKGVIIREILMGDNDPARTFWKDFMETAYRVHPVRYPIIGYKNVFETVTREQLMDYYRRRYVPDNAIVGVVGNVDPIAVLKQVIRQGGPTPAGLRPITLPEEPPQVSPRRVEIESPLARITRAQVAFPSIDLTGPDLYALDVLAMILGQGRTSRLYQALKDEHKSVLSVDGSSWTPSFVRGLFLISLALDYRSLDAALDQMWDVIERIKTEGPTPEEFQRAKTKVKAGYIFSKESASSVAGDLVSSYAATGDPYFNELYTDRIQKVDITSIQAVAGKYLNKNNVTVVVLKPKRAVDQSVTQAAEKVQSSETRKTVLKNGLTLLTKVNRSTPTVSIQLFGAGGQIYEPKDEPGISSFTANMLTRGTENYSKQELSRAVEDMGASLYSGSGRNSIYVKMSLLSSDLAKGFKLFGEVVARPVFPRDEIDKLKTDTIQAIKTLDEDWQQEIMRLLNQSQFTLHPYRNDLLGTPAAVQSFTREKLEQFYKSLLYSNHLVLAVFGDIDPEQVESLVREELGGIEPGELPPNRSIPTEYLIADNREVRKQDEKSSSGLMLAYNGVGITSPERPALDVLDALISGIGYPSGWLHQALRGGDRDLVYVIHAFPRYAPDGGNFLVMAQSSPQDLDMVKKIVEEQISRLLTDPIDRGEFKRAKEAVIINHEMGLETNAHQAGEAALDELLGLGYDYATRYVEQVRKVTAEDVKKVAEEHLRKALIVETVPAPTGAKS